MSEDRSPLLGTPVAARAARWGVIAWSLIGVLLVLFILFRYVILPIKIIFPPLVLSLIFVYVLNPVVSWLQRNGIGRVWGSLITYVVLLGALGVGLRFLIPIVADQVDGFIRAVPSLVSRAQEWFSDLSQRFGGDGSTSESFRLTTAQVQDVADRLFGITLGILNGALILVLGLILGFYLLVDLPKIKRGIVAFIPASRRPELLSVGAKLGRAVGGFFRGQLLVALFVGLASMLALFIVGLPYWAIVGLITGLFNLIPLIGPFIGGGIAAFVAFTSQSSAAGLISLEPGLPLAIGAAIGLFVVQQIDNHVISPNVVARTVKLHPVTVMLALLAGGTLLGLWGMLLAVPVFASAKILVLHAWDTQATWPPAEEPVVRREAAAATGAVPEAPPVSAGDGSAEGTRWARTARRWLRVLPSRRGAKRGAPEQPAPKG